MDVDDSTTQDEAALYMMWYRAMRTTYEAMSLEEREHLHAWELENLPDSLLATSDWPGWEKYIGKPPWEETL